MAARRTTGKCTACGIRKISKTNIGPEMCAECNEYYEWDNAHNDDDHEGVLGIGPGPVVWGTTTHTRRADFNAWLADRKRETRNCPVCHPELDPRDEERPAGHTNTVARSHNSHTGHHHPRTPRHRAACRKSLAATGKPLDVRPAK